MWRAFVYGDTGTRSHPPGLRRVQAARRQVRRQRARAGEERAARFPAARAVQPAVRRDAEHAAGPRAPDHQGVPGRGHAPRLPRAALRGGAEVRHLRQGGGARRWRASSTAPYTATPAPRSPASPTSATTRNWTGSHFNQANWYVFGRMAWDPDVSAQARRRRVGSPDLLQRSGRRRPGGDDDDGLAPDAGELHDAARARAHHGDATITTVRRPGSTTSARANWNPFYYHKADATGLGFDRTAQPAATRSRSTRATVRDKLRQPGHRRRTTSCSSSSASAGTTSWPRRGERSGKSWSTATAWASTACRRCVTRGRRLQGRIDAKRFKEVDGLPADPALRSPLVARRLPALLRQRQQEAIPSGYAAPGHDLAFFKGLESSCPSNAAKPRCNSVYVRHAVARDHQIARQTVILKPMSRSEAAMPPRRPQFSRGISLSTMKTSVLGIPAASKRVAISP